MSNQDAILKPELHFFDPNRERVVFERRLPHWVQAGTLAFITWRTDDSMPRHVVQRWKDERSRWLVQNGIDGNRPDWRNQLGELSQDKQSEFASRCSDRWNDALDECHGVCALRRPELAQIVADSLTHFDGERYDLTDFVVMPNHVHLLATFRDEKGMLAQQESWKHFTANQINRRLERTGRFWQQDGFDRLVRSQAAFDHYRAYIADNPQKAGLKTGEFLHFSKRSPHAPP